MMPQPGRLGMTCRSSPRLATGSTAELEAVPVVLFTTAVVYVLYELAPGSNNVKQWRDLTGSSSSAYPDAHRVRRLRRAVSTRLSASPRLEQQRARLEQPSDRLQKTVVRAASDLKVVRLPRTSTPTAVLEPCLEQAQLLALRQRLLPCSSGPVAPPAPIITLARRNECASGSQHVACSPTSDARRATWKVRLVCTPPPQLPTRRSSRSASSLLH